MEVPVELLDVYIEGLERPQKDEVDVTVWRNDAIALLPRPA